jgi:hypothetical protein
VNESNLIAVDAIPIRRSHSTSPGESRSFKGLMAVAISVHDVDEFQKQYERAVDEVFAEISLERLKKVYKAYEIAKALSGRHTIADAVFFRFGRKLLGIDGLRINVFHAFFDARVIIEQEGLKSTGDGAKDFNTLQMVPVFGGLPGRKYVTLRELMDLVEPAFPALAAWKLTAVTGTSNHNFLLDEVGGSISKAWDDLTSHNNVQTVPHGDSCSPYISAADLLLRALDRQLTRDYSFLDKSGLERALGEIGGVDQRATCYVRGISNDDIPMIAPYMERPIPTEYFCRHPIFVIVNESTHKDEHEELENSPLVRRVHDLAYEHGGSVTYYNPKVSTSLFRDGDYIVHYGEKGKETFKRLKAMGFRLNDWSSGEASANTRT